MTLVELIKVLNDGKLKVYWKDYKHQIHMVGGNIKVIHSDTQRHMSLLESDLVHCFIV